MVIQLGASSMKKSNKSIVIIISIVILLLSFITIVGQFLFFPKDSEGLDNNNTLSTETTSTNQSSSTQTQLAPPVVYKRTSEIINNYKQEVFTIEFDPLDNRIEFKPVLSFDSLFGFEKLSDMLLRENAYAGVNGAFFYEYGDPVGMAVIDGYMFSASTGMYPVLVINSKGAELRNLWTNIHYTINGQKTRVDNMNRTSKGNDIILYTSGYGSTNRVKEKNSVVMVEDNKIIAIRKGVTQSELHDNISTLCFFGDKMKLVEKYKIGDQLIIDIQPKFDKYSQAYECGAWLVQDGKNVVKDWDAWVGNLTNYDPRTAIAIKPDGRVILLVVDGRQKDYSMGMSAKQLAEYLIKLGVKDAAMLDGGASSQMIVDGKLVNRPSDRGIERPLGGGLFVRIKTDGLKQTD